jgi:tRNA uridine 5-carbamoylmethylation protein Kti12
MDNLTGSDGEIALSVKTATVLLLCGLPGSGKSSIAKRVVESFHGHALHRVDHVEYDDLARQLQEQLHEQDDAHALNLSRESYAGEETDYSPNCGDAKNNNQQDEESWLIAWRKSRTRALQVVLRVLNQHFRRSNAEANNHCSHLTVVMDDNFFLRSMRRDVYKICQQAAVCWENKANHDQDNATIQNFIYFGIVWMDTPLDVCLVRNRQRTHVLPDETIVKMSTRFEPPNSEKYDFERHSLQIHGDGDDDHSYNEQQDQIVSILSNVMAFINSLRQSHSAVSLPPPPPDGAKLAEERRNTIESQLHTYDKMLRSWVGHVAQMERSAAGPANATRQRLLQQLRQQQQDNDSDTNIAVLFEWFWQDLSHHPTALQDWSQDQQGELRRRALQQRQQK